MIKSPKTTIVLLIMLTFIPLFLIFYGIDFTDTGWMLTYFQNIFTSPESVTFWFHLYLTNIIGGLWNLFFGNLGLLGFNIGGVIILWITSIFIYKIFKDIMHRNYILLGIFIGLVFYLYDKVTIIHYNNLSLLFSVITIFYIKKGITQKSIYFIIAGITVALNSFVRLPNIVNSLFIIPVIYYHIAQKNNFKIIIQDILYALTGFILGTLLIFSLMKILGHFDIYINSLKELFASTEDSNSKYSLNEISWRFTKQFARSVIKASIFSAILFLINFLYLKLESKRKFLNLIIIIPTILSSILFYIFVSSHDISDYYKIIIGFIIITFCFIFFARNQISIYVKTIAMLTVLLIVTLSLGSDTGIKVGSYGIIIASPLFLWFWYEFKIKELSFQPAVILLLIFFGINSLLLLSKATYRDSLNIIDMNTKVNNNLLIGVKTTKDRAVLINELLSELNKIEITNDTLFCFESIGMVHYLTKTKPYISNPWPLMEQPSVLKQLLKENEKNFLPIIVMAKKDTRSTTWPHIDRLSVRPNDIKMRGIVNNFIIQNNYTTVWSNSMFTILKPLNK